MPEEKFYSLQEMQRLNKKAGGCFFDKSHLSHDLKYKAQYSVIRNVLTVHFPEGDESHDKPYDLTYIFRPESGDMRPVVDGKPI